MPREAQHTAFHLQNESPPWDLDKYPWLWNVRAHGLVNGMHVDDMSGFHTSYLRRALIHFESSAERSLPNQSESQSYHLASKLESFLSPHANLQ